MSDVVPPPDELWVCHLGRVLYSDAIAIQETLRTRRQADELPDLLLLLEHPPVYTRGRRSGSEELPLGEDFYGAKGIEVHTTDRGGKLTYHAPGQLVGYPIMRIADVGAYLRTMEGAIVEALARFGVEARWRCAEGPDYTGVWVDERKIASIGVHVSRGVTTHGFAVNLDNDLTPFSWVIACGLPDVAMTSLAQEIASEEDPGAPTLLARFRAQMADSFARAHDRRATLVSPEQLGIDATHAAGRAVGRAPINTSPTPLEPIPA